MYLNSFEKSNIDILYEVSAIVEFGPSRQKAQRKAWKLNL